MKQAAWNPHPGSMSAAQWVVRRIKLEEFTPNAEFARQINEHPIECWLDDEGCLFIATPAQDGTRVLDGAEKRIEELENKVKCVLEQQRLLELVKKDDQDKEGPLPF